MSRGRPSLLRYDVHTNAGRGPDAPMYCIALNISPTAAFGLCKTLEDQGWAVEVKVTEDSGSKYAAQLLMQLHQSERGSARIRPAS